MLHQADQSYKGALQCRGNSATKRDAALAIREINIELIKQKINLEYVDAYGSVFEVWSRFPATHPRHAR